MNKKFAIVKVHKYFGTYIRIMEHHDFETCVSCSAKFDILFESDDYTEVCDKYQEYKSAQEDIIHV